MPGSPNRFAQSGVDPAAWLRLRCCPQPQRQSRMSSVSRAEAIERISQYFHSGDFLRELGRRVAYPTESQNAGRRDALRAYLEADLIPTLAELGFSTRIIESPNGKFPFLVAEYHEGPSL